MSKVPGQKWGRGFSAPIVIVEIVAAVGVFFGALQSQGGAEQRSFESLASDRLDLVANAVQDLCQWLDSVNNLFESSKLVRPEQFATFTKQCMAPTSPVLSLVWAPRVARRDRESHEALQRLALNDPNYRIEAASPDGLGPRYATHDAFPVVYATGQIVCATRGQDLGRARSLARHIQTAILNDRVHAAHASQSVMTECDKDALVGIRPVFDAGDHSKLAGILVCFFDLGHLVRGAVADHPTAGIDFEILDQSRHDRLCLHLSRTRPPSSAALAPATLYARSRFKTSMRLRVGNVSFPVRLWSAPAFKPTVPSRLSLVMLGATILALSALCTICIALLAHRRATRRQVAAAAEELRETHQALHQESERAAKTEERYRVTFEQAAVGIAHVAPDGEWLRVNQTFQDILGYDSGELSDRRLEDLLHQQDADDYRGALAGMAGGSRTPWTMEARCVSQCGILVWVDLSVAAVADAEDGIDYLVVVAEDITSRKMLARELEDMNRDLELRVVERTEALERSNKELEQFAYIASHDLQEPLRMVTSYVQLLERRYAECFDEDGREFVQFAVDGTARMKTLIQDLLAYSRVGTTPPTSDTVDTETALATVIETLEVTIEESGAEITHDHLPEIHGSRSQVVQLFQNLIVNAIKYRREVTPHIHVSAERHDDEWTFAFRDNGSGIEERHYERVFAVFQRLHSRAGSGTGIGLAVCKKIVERHGGRIWIESEPGSGSTFFLTLPAATTMRRIHAPI